MNCMLCLRSCIFRADSVIPRHIMLLFQRRGHENLALVTSVICWEESGVPKQNACTSLVTAQSPGTSPN